LTYVVEAGQHRFDIQLSPEAGDPPVVKKDSVRIGTKVGQFAPEIEGDDLDGRFFKLSEQRGKVVVLIFWGHWCRLCRDQYPHERSLVERLKGKPAVVLGVNSDEDRTLIVAQNAKNQINWRSWWDGEMWGSVGRTWQLPGWPGVFVIDATGVIRAINPLGAELDRVVDELFAETP
jgi:thiol-disulfide isomerase/thioredoxin